MLSNDEIRTFRFRVQQLDSDEIAPLQTALAALEALIAIRLEKGGLRERLEALEKWVEAQCSLQREAAERPPNRSPS